MGVTLSPSIVTNGLTFAYDEKNNSKSFIGAPTTNLADFPATGYNWVNAGAADYSNDDTTESLPDELAGKYFTTPLKVVSCKTTTAATSGQECGYAFTSVSGSTQYTMSLWFKKNRDNMNSYGPYVRQSVNNDWHGTFDYNGETNNALWPTNKWIRIKSTFTTSSNETGVYLSNYIGEYVGDKVCYCGGQVEQKSFATPLAQGTRTTSNTVFDMVGGNTITPVSPTYNSDGTISYLGSGQRLHTNITSFGNNTTWEVWFKSNGNVSTYNMFMGRLLPYFGHYAGSSIIFSNNIGGSQRTFYSNGTVNSGVWNHCVFTTVFDGTNTTEYLYINGVLDNSGTWSGSQGAYGYNFSIGDGYNDSWYRFDGQIPIVRIYNRALSATEVKQNYNAMRGRFGV